MSDVFKHAPQQAKMHDKVIAEDKRNAWRDDAKGVAARVRLQHGHIPEFIASEVARGTDINTYAEGITKNLALVIATFAINTNSPALTAIRFLQELMDETRRIIETCQTGDVDGGFVKVNRRTGTIVDADPLEGFKS
jgi:hypothetical protein